MATFGKLVKDLNAENYFRITSLIKPLFVI